MSEEDHLNDFDETEHLPDFDNEGFQCAAYVEGRRWICPIAGTEACDWQCPNGSITEVQKGPKS